MKESDFAWLDGRYDRKAPLNVSPGYFESETRLVVRNDAGEAVLIVDNCTPQQMVDKEFHETLIALVKARYPE